MGPGERHEAVDRLVHGLALLLLLLLGWAGLRRWAPRLLARAASAGPGADVGPADVHELESSGTERAVDSVAAVKVLAGGAKGAKPVKRGVPAP